MTIPEPSNLEGVPMGYEPETGLANWDALKERFRAPCGGTVCVNVVRVPVPDDRESFPLCGYLKMVLPRNPFYRGDTIRMYVKEPCRPGSPPSPGSPSPGSPPPSSPSPTPSSPAPPTSPGAGTQGSGGGGGGGGTVTPSPAVRATGATVR
ncbi:hypothetical protein GCM10010329_52270 [Streptomyces spiroverticillatus]|uniref:Uncharacterized protein n=1 Tax=Streptomyces finlayi TaxID=67296 RepID=A0A918X1W2_9ACTN|nr:hypothetical protein [Streptomyces finlayi]GHA22477.1 hypothetical protein GCM10010329_52270 [Streptomyces spiroverticillatus]GHD04423.1 hypothetical protein GCM10010334_53210 [Streptomyces finlayi]